MMEVLQRDGLARIARVSTRHGVIETPAVLPVINPNIITVPLAEIRKLGFNALITNGYIIRRTEKLRSVAEEKGLHSLLDFNGPIMTDSGTFQEHVYGGVEFDNSDMVQFQDRIGSDIVTIRDIFTNPEDKYETVKAAVEETYARAKGSKVSEGTLLAGVIQGGIFPDLRKHSAKLMTRVSDYLPIGGVVPLLENYRYSDLVDIIVNSKLNAGFNRPIHLFGGGHPMFIPMAVLLGVDLFDSASYVKYARGNRVLFQDGTRDLSKLFELPYWSPLEGKVNAKELQKMEEEERVYWLSVHNLAAIALEIRETKERINEGSLWQYAEWRSQAHPFLRDAFRRLSGYSGRLNGFFEISKKSAMFFSDSYSMANPYVSRIRKFTSSYKKSRVPVQCISLSRLKKKSAADIISAYDSSSAAVLMPWNGIHVPIELEETFPVQQSISSRMFGDHRCGHDNLEFPEDREKARDFDIEKLRVIADYQYGTGIGKALIPNEAEIRKSRKTGRIRTISHNGNIIATMRAMDGFLTLTFEGARLIAEKGKDLGVTVTDDSAEFNSKGYNVFSKFVTRASAKILPGNDTLVYNSAGQLIAVGKAAMSGKEMMHFDNGVAVNVHSGVDN